MFLTRVPRAVLFRVSMIVLLLLGFSALWFILAGYLTAYSDEISHLAVAKGLLLTGEPFAVDFDRCAALISQQYRRGLEISQWTAWSYRLFGESLRAARLVPFLWTLATWLLYVGYVRVRGRATSGHLLVATLLFLGQSMVLEHALNVRMYAPLLFLLLLALIALWEAQRTWSLSGWSHRSAIWIGAACLLIAFPTIRGWHVLQAAIVLFSGVLLWLSGHPAAARPILSVWQDIVELPRLWRYLLFGLALYALLCVWLISPRVLDVLATRLVGAVRVHSTPWDNLMGLFRMCVALNVVLLLWMRRTPNAQPTFTSDFNGWLLSSGIVSGLLIGLLMNSTHIFYSKYFYLSIGIAVLGASGRLAMMPSRSARIACAAAYLLVNGALSGVTLGLDRSNIPKAITWLREHSSEQDLIFSFRAELALHGGEELCRRTISILPPRESPDDKEASKGFGWIRRDARNPWLVGEEVQAILASHPSSAAVYFLYTDAYDFRNGLYEWTTGRPRPEQRFSPPGVYSLHAILTSPEVSEEVIPGLRGCNLRRVDREQLLQALERDAQ